MNIVYTESVSKARYNKLYESYLKEEKRENITVIFIILAFYLLIGGYAFYCLLGYIFGFSDMYFKQSIGIVLYSVIFTYSSVIAAGVIYLSVGTIRHLNYQTFEDKILVGDRYIKAKLIEEIDITKCLNDEAFYTDVRYYIIKTKRNVIKTYIEESGTKFAEIYVDVLAEDDSVETLLVGHMPVKPQLGIQQETLNFNKNTVYIPYGGKK